MLAAAGFFGHGPKVFLGWLAAQGNERDFDRHPDPSTEAAAGIEIVTWHGAKGNEWPVTVVCELDSEVAERENTTRAAFTDFSDLARVPDAALLVDTPHCFTPETRARFLAERQPAAEAEARNLIYVALTRARDRLILEWTDPVLDKDTVSHLSLLVHEGQVSLSAGLVVAGQPFAARILADPAGAGREPVAAPTRPHHRFGASAPLPLVAAATPWRRRPSTLAQAEPLPVAPRQVMLGAPQPIWRTLAAAARGTAWHLAFRVLATRTEAAHRLQAATGLSDPTLARIAARVAALRGWLQGQGFGDLEVEVPIHVTHPDGPQTLGILDAIAIGPRGLLILDHKTGPAPNPAARFQTYWPQLAAYAESLRLAFPQRPILGVAIHWLDEGTLSLADLAPATTA